MKKFWLLRIFLLCVVSGAPGLFPALANTAPPRLESVTDQVKIYHDVVNVGLIQRNGKALLIDSGDGSVLAAAKRLGIRAIDWVLYTHHHRDQCSGAARLKKAGVKIAVPASEAAFFRNASEFWLSADKILDHRYNFRPDLFVLRESVPPDRELQPGEVFSWQGIEIRIVPTPGHTDGGVSYLVDIDGQRIAFTGDLIYGPGQIWEFYSLQKGFPAMPGDYWGFGGAVPEVLKSLNSVLSYKPTVLVPSHGMVMTSPEPAVNLLRSRLVAAMTNYLTLSTVRFDHPEWRMVEHLSPRSDVPMFAPLPPVKAPPWLRKGTGTSSYIQADDGTIFVFDAGFTEQDIDRLLKSKVISGVDAVWISHYHDDHVPQVNTIRRRYGARIYAQKELQDILENPRAYPMPCLFPESIHVDHALAEGEFINWKGYKLTGFHFPGQTLYHGGLLVEREGVRVFMVGDSTFNWGIDDYCSYNRNFLGRDNGYEQCLRLLLKVKPDMLWPAHRRAEPVSDEYLQKTLDLLARREALFAQLFPWDNPNFGLDPYWVRAYPYRQSILKGQRVTLEVRIFNHSESAQQASVELRVPAGWRTHPSAPLLISPKSEGKIRLTAQAPVNPSQRREVLGLAVNFGSRKLGEASEAIVDYLQ